MTARWKWAIAGFAVVLLGGAASAGVKRQRAKATEVRLEAVKKRDLVAKVTASGNVRARRSVDMSSDVSARVTQLLVEEGQDVKAGQILLRLDPTQLEAAASRARAVLSQTEAQAAQTEANQLRAQRDYARLKSLSERDS